jgi:hypothetical protein
VDSSQLADAPEHTEWMSLYIIAESYNPF